MGRAARAHGYRVAAFDSPGSGYSDTWQGTWSADDVAELWLAVLDHLQAEQACIGGHCYGATATMVALPHIAHRVRGVVLLDCGHLDYVQPGNLPGYYDIHEKWLGEERYSTWEAFLEQARPETPHWDADMEAFVRSSMHEQDGQIVPLLTVVGANQAVGIAAAYEIDRLPQLETPALLLVATEPGEEEPTRQDGIARLKARLPNLTVIPVEGAHHDVVRCNPGFVLQQVWAFLDMLRQG